MVDQLRTNRMRGAEPGPEPYDYPKLTPEEDAAQRGSDPPTTRGGDTTTQTAPPDGATLERQAQARKWLEGGGRDRPQGRKHGLWPYLLVRAMAGDSGGRPLPSGQPFWESPDIIVVPGTPTTYDGSTATLNPTPGQPHTVFVRVWNLGHLAATGVKVRVWWANPSFSFTDPSHPPTFIGATYVDLPDRRSPNCVGLVRIPTPWVPVVENGGHECLLGKVECFTDGSAPGWDASMNRHVGQHNLMLATGGMSIQPLLANLSATLAIGAHVELRHSTADLQTTLLVHEPGLLGQLVTPALAHDHLLSPVRARARAAGAATADAGTAATPVLERRLGAIAFAGTPGARIVPGAALAGMAHRMGGVADPGLVGFGHPGVTPVPDATPPLVGFMNHLGFRDLTAGAIAQRLGGGANAGHLLRLEATQNGQVVGGYTIVVADTAS